MSEKQAESKAAMSEGIVARGRTVMINGKAYGPGEKVHLASDEIARLTKAGFLVDTSVPEIPTGNGPVFGNQGPQIRQVA